MLFADVDFTGLELCTVAQACLDTVGESALGEALNAGVDVHLQFAAQLLGLAYEEAAERKRDKEVKDARQLAKCFHPDTEVLTLCRGWVRVGEVTMDDELATPFVAENGRVDMWWTKPVALTTRQADNGLVHLKNEGIDLRVTPDHRMVAWGGRGNIRTVAPEKLGSVRYWPNAGLLPRGRDDIDETLLRLAVATQADGSFMNKQIRFGFSKQRKVDRLEGLLKLFENPSGWKKYAKNERGVTTFTVKRDLSDKIRSLLDGKQLSWALLDLSPRLRQIVLEESEHWDGQRQPNWRAFHVTSVEKQNVDILQALASITNKKSRTRVWKRKDPRHRDVWTIAIKQKNRSRGENLSIQKIAYDGPVYCLTTVTDYILVRDGGVPVITHQCANFGFPGGLGARGFVKFARKGYGLKLEESFAKDLKRQWLNQWPEFHGYFKFVAGICSEGTGDVEQLRVGRVRGRCTYTQACNTFFQGLGADGAKRALWAATRAMYAEPESPLYGCRAPLFVHDQIVAEVPEEPRAADAAARELGRVMCDACNELLPDVPVKAAPCLTKHWHKDAEQVLDESGLIIPWDLAKKNRTVCWYPDGKQVEW